MAEMSTAENEQLVAHVYTKTLEARTAETELSGSDQMVYEIETLSQEVNSGASFEQYFRWASLDALPTVVTRLQSLGLVALADITRRAFDVAFPNGLPKSDEEKDALTRWTAEQERQLHALAEEFTEFNGSITNALASFYRLNQSGG